MDGSHTLIGYLLAMKAPSSRPRARAHREWKMDAILADQRNILRYQEELLGTVRVVEGGARDLMREIRSAVTANAALKGTDASPDVDAVVRRFAARFGDIGLTARRLAKVAAKLNAKSVDERLAKEIHRAMGVDVGKLFVHDVKMAAAMETAAAANAALITDVRADVIAGVKNVVSEGWAAGKRWESMVDDIGQVMDTTETRARLIARDQVGKMNSAFNEARQTSAGIEMYDWSGVGDERERQSHRDMEGVRCRWDSPPMVDGQLAHPGEPIQCRCGARPVFVLLEQAEAA